MPWVPVASLYGASGDWQAALVLPGWGVSRPGQSRHGEGRFPLRAGGGEGPGYSHARPGDGCCAAKPAREGQKEPSASYSLTLLGQPTRTEQCRAALSSGTGQHATVQSHARKPPSTGVQAAQDILWRGYSGCLDRDGISSQAPTHLGSGRASPGSGAWDRPLCCRPRLYHAVQGGNRAQTVQEAPTCFVTAAPRAWRVCRHACLLLCHRVPSSGS